VNGEDSVLNISKITSFEWDSLYIFKPYTPLDTIKKQIGFEWEGLESALVNQSDNFNLLLFIKAKQVVSFVQLPRNYGDFARITTSGPCVKSGSAFYVRKDFFGSQNWIYLYEVPN
jgi:hypothetical protein